MWISEFLELNRDQVTGVRRMVSEGLDEEAAGAAVVRPSSSLAGDSADGNGVPDGGACLQPLRAWLLEST